MGRPERNVDPDSGPVARFACDLRALRQAAGSPSYRHLAAKANYSATVLSRAASGRELPSLPVVLAYVTACGDDVAEWRERWLSLVDRPRPRAAGEDDPGERTEYGAPEPDVQAGSEGQPASANQAGARTVVTRYRAPLAGLAVFATAATSAAVVFAIAGLVISHTIAQGTSASRTPTIRPAAPHDMPSDYADPRAAGCVAGAVPVSSAYLRLDKATVISGTSMLAGTVVGMVELIYSARCRAAWSRATPLRGFNMNSIDRLQVQIARPADGASKLSRVSGIKIAYGVDGPLLLTNHGCLIASASFQFRNGGDASAVTSCWSMP